MNWGKALAMALIAFAGLMTFFVVMAARNPEPLVTERYYEQELKYQERIDDAARAGELSAAVGIAVIDGAVHLRFPAEMKGSAVAGELTLLCPNDPNGDHTISVNADEAGAFISPPLKLRPGRYNAELVWSTDGRSYYTEQKFDRAVNVLLTTAFVLGAAGSAHCVVMCGPIALAVPSPGTRPSSRLVSTLLMNGGRLMSYALLGAAFGAFGYGLRLAGLQQFVTITAGALLLLSVIVPGSLERWSPTGRIGLGIGRLRGVLARNLKRTAPEALLLTGMLNGLLPCGLLYSALIGATAMDSWYAAAFFMIFFGLGTWPAMIALRMSGALVGPKLRAPLRKLAPVVMCAMGLLLILRGSGLDIPLLSPGAAQAPVPVTACH